jgi:hypothetical protein
MKLVHAALIGVSTIALMFQSSSAFAVQTSLCPEEIHLQLGAVTYTRPITSVFDQQDSYLLSQISAEGYILPMVLTSTYHSECRYLVDLPNNKVEFDNGAILSISEMTIQGTHAKPEVAVDFSLSGNVPGFGEVSKAYVAYAALSDYSGDNDFFSTNPFVSVYVQTCRPIWDDCLPALIQVGEWNGFYLGYFQIDNF